VIKPQKTFRNTWLFEGWENQPSFLTRKMFGGLAVYLHGRLMIMLTESLGDREWKGKQYPFDLWNGVLVCTNKEHQLDLLKLLPGAIPHPILPKWLYLSAQLETFEELAAAAAQLARRNSPLIGVVPKEKKKGGSIGRKKRIVRNRGRRS
jgi:hypothetical protein